MSKKIEHYPLNYLGRSDVMELLELSKASYNKWAATGLLLALQARHNYHFIEGYTHDLRVKLLANRELRAPLPQVEIARQFAQASIPKAIGTKSHFNSRVHELRHVIDGEAYLLPEDVLPLVGFRSFEQDTQEHFGVEYFGVQPIIPTAVMLGNVANKGVAWQHKAFMNPDGSPARS